jgi:hypothetical protein
MLGYDAKAIARWDVVPYQTFTGDFHVGVVAFHINGIDRVDFSVNGGPWASVYEMQLNPDSNVWEYTARLRAEDFADGPVEVRAIAWPSGAGEPRVLESLVVYANAGGTLPTAEVFVSPSGDDVNNDGSRGSPFRSIFRAGMAIQAMLGGRADGGVISLLPGDHQWGTAGRNANGQYIGNLITVDRWLEVRVAAGVDPAQVRITSTGSGGLKTHRVRIDGVVLQTSPGNAVVPGTQPMLWLSNCTMIGVDRLTDTRWTPASNYPGGMYVTECQISSGRYGIMSATLARNVTVESTGDDAFTNNQMVVNAIVRDLRIPPGSGFHGDVVQLHASSTPHENVIVYNLRAIDCSVQPWHIGYTGHVKGPDWSNIAFVNYLVENEHQGYAAQWSVSANHLLWWHVGIIGSPTYIRDTNRTGYPADPATIRNISVRNCIFDRFHLVNTGQYPVVEDQLWAHNNHFRDTTTYGAVVVGSGATVGGTHDVLFMNPAANDFRPRAAILLGRCSDRLTPRDAAGEPFLGAIGPLQNSLQP